MKKVLSATFLVILVTLECLGDRNTPGDVTSWARATQPPTTVAAFVVRFPSIETNSPTYQAPDFRISQNEGVQPRNVTTRRPCNCKSSVEPLAGSQPHTTVKPADVGIQNNNEPVADAADVINNQLRQFGLDMLIQLSVIDSTSNLILSPFSIWSVLLVILEGARRTTAEQIRTTLHLPQDAAQIRSNFKFIESGLVNVSGSAIFNSVSALFYDVHRPLNADYERRVQQSYHAEVHAINFSSPDETVWNVNHWVANKTNNRITRLIHAGDLKRPELLVTNAIYFKGFWETPFNFTATKKAKFYNEDNVHIADVDMMYQKGVYLYSFIREINSHVLDMPYKDHSFRMLLILPQQGNTLLNVYHAMKRFPVNECYKRLLEEQEMYSDAEIPVYLPRFKFKNDRTINTILQNLGVQHLFEPDAADLTGMTQSKLYLTKMIHIAEIEVNEKGTTASGATGAIFGNKQSPPKFVGNRPFAFFIVEDSRKTVIFAGRVLNPNQID